MAHIAAVRADARIAGVEFALFSPVAPIRGAARSLCQPGGLFFQLGLLRPLKLVLPVAVLLPGAEIPRLYLDVRPVEREDMVHAAVEQGAVVGDQDKPLFPVQIPAHGVARLLVQMVGRLVDEQEPVLVEEQGRQQHLGLLAVAQGTKRAVQHLRIHPQQGQFPL